MPGARPIFLAVASPRTVSLSVIILVVKSREGDATSLRDTNFTDLPRLQEIERQAGEVFRAAGMNAVADDEPLGLEMLTWSTSSSSLGPKTWTVTHSSMRSARSGITRAWQVTPCSTRQCTGGGCTHRWPGPSASARA